MTFLITGAAGFIGSNLVDTLLREGHSVVGIDNFDRFYSKEIKEQNLRDALQHSTFRFIEGDIRDRGMLMQAFDCKPDIVIHLAAKAGVRPSLEAPEAYFDVNVNGTIRLLEVMNAVGVKKMLFASSSSVYGNNEKVPFSEHDSVDNPISPYAASKKAAELICHTYSHLYGFDIFCLRFFTVYGPRQRPEMAIHKFAAKIDKDQEIPLFGDGSSRRDYTFISDIIDGIKGAIKNLRGYEIINLGESSTISLIDLVTLIEKEVGNKAKINWLPMQPGDVEITFANIDKAKRLVGYNPGFPVGKGIHDFVKWYKNSKNGR